MRMCQAFNQLLDVQQTEEEDDHAEDTICQRCICLCRSKQFKVEAVCNGIIVVRHFVITIYRKYTMQYLFFSPQWMYF